MGSNSSLEFTWGYVNTNLARMQNSAPQKQWLFTPVRKGQVNQWIKLGNDWKVSQEQLRRTLFNKQELHELLQALAISPGANAL